MDINKSKYFSALEILNNELYYYDNLKVEDKSSNQMLGWFIEVVRKNKAIYKSKIDRAIQDQETYNKQRQYLYLIDFGKPIGSEIHDEHFAVVIKELELIAIVVPLTTKKEYVPDWMKNNDLVIDIGIVEGFPDDCKECYANISGIQSVSKKRLSQYGDKKSKKYYDIKISDEQMLIIEENLICKLCNRTLDNVIII